MKKFAFNVISSATLLATAAVPVVATVAPIAASAATKDTVIGAVPSVSDTGNTTLGQVKIDEDGNAGQFADGDILVLTLPSGVKWNGTPAVTVSGADITVPAANITRVSDQVVDVKLTVAATRTAAGSITISTPVDVTSTGTGDIQLNVAAPGTGITEGNFTIGKFVSGGATAVALSTETEGGTGTYGTVRVVENAVGAIDNGKTITLALPAGFTWNGDAANVSANNATVTAAGTGTRTLTLTVTAKSTTRPAIIDIATNAIADNTAAKGDVHVAVGGTATVTGTDLVVGKYADWGSTVSSDSPKTIKAGVNTQNLADVTVEETVAGSLIPNRTITFDLPDNVRWGATAPTLTLDSGNSIWTTRAGVVSNNGKTATFTLNGTASTSAAKLKLVGQTVDVSPAFSGDLHVVVGGTAGVTGDVVPAKVTPIATSTPSATSLQLGVQNQNLSDFTVTEGDKGIFTGTLSLKLPAGATWSATPTVTVTDGDLQVGTVSRTTGDVANDTVAVTIKGSSSIKPSTIKVSGGQVTTNSVLPAGPLKASISAQAAQTNVTDQLFASTSGPSVVVGNVVTDSYVPASSFTIGKTSYTVNGVQKTLDVAPYTEAGRTYLPIRFVANAVGVSDDNIVWNDATKTVTLIKGDRVATFKVGQSSYTVNGAVVPMDAAAQFKQNRNMIPLRYAAQALGVSISWDDATQTVTVGQ